MSQCEVCMLYKDICYLNPFHDAIKEKNLQTLKSLVDKCDMTSLVQGKIYYGHPLMEAVRAGWSKGVELLCVEMTKSLELNDNSDKGLLDSLDGLLCNIIPTADKNSESPRRYLRFLSGSELRHELFEIAKANEAVLDILHRFCKEGDVYGDELKEKERKYREEEDKRRAAIMTERKNQIQSAFDEQKIIFDKLTIELGNVKEIFSQADIKQMKLVAGYSKDIGEFFNGLSARMGIDKNELSERFISLYEAKKAYQKAYLSNINSSSQSAGWGGAGMYASGAIQKNSDTLSRLKDKIAVKAWVNVPTKYTFLKGKEVTLADVFSYIKEQNLAAPRLKR